MNFLLVIYSCHKYISLKDYYVNKYKALGFDVIFVFADPTITEDVDYIYDSENNMAVLKCKDEFEFLSYKTYYLTKMLLTSSRLKKYDYVIKMDDDTEFNINCSNLSTSNIFTNNTHYCGPKLLVSEPMEHDYHFGKCTVNMDLNITPFKLNEKLSWGIGHFYILSKFAIKLINDHITKNINILDEFLYEDMLVGKILNDNNINYIQCLNRNIITDLKRPRTNSINTLLYNNNDDNNVIYTKFNNSIKGINKIKTVTFNLNKNPYENTITNIDEELRINAELDKKLKELNNKMQKTQQHNTQQLTNPPKQQLNTQKNNNVKYTKFHNSNKHIKTTQICKRR
jgi:hypothetical protein